MSPSPIEFGIATIGDLGQIAAMLRDDPLGSTREPADDAAYVPAFEEITADPNLHLIVGREGDRVVAFLQLSFIPTLSRGGLKRAQFEGVRVHPSRRGMGVGKALCLFAIRMAKDAGCGMVQLTSDHRRPEAIPFYESMGFVNSHNGLKLMFPEVEV